tara:strand:+ start:51 stop:197 length:147 start_codon:yes stop_codon:yes gene_type:complete
MKKVESYADVMQAYKHPPSIKYIPRIFSWMIVFVSLYGLSTTAYAGIL